MENSETDTRTLGEDIKRMRVELIELRDEARSITEVCNRALCELEGIDTRDDLVKFAEMTSKQLDGYKHIEIF